MPEAVLIVAELGICGEQLDALGRGEKRRDGDIRVLWSAAAFLISSCHAAITGAVAYADRRTRGRC